MKFYWLVFIAAFTLLFYACNKKDLQLPEPPVESDAAFTYSPSAANDNIIEFTASTSGVIAKWDFGNGALGSGTNISATFPNAGTYQVTLSIFAPGGSVSSSQEIVIKETDLSLLNSPLLVKLTGGSTGDGFKTWVLDSANSTHFGVGPDPVGSQGNFPEWWAASPGDKNGCGLYNDRYVFHLDNFKFDMITNGDVYVSNELAADFPGSFENLGDFTAPYSDQIDELWTLTEDEDTMLSVSGSSFIGFWSGVADYKVIQLTDTSLWLQYQHHAGGLLWYLRLIPEGFVSGNNNGGSGGGGATDPNVTFLVDMNQVPDAFTTPEINGEFNNWCGNCNPLSDDDTDNIWETTIEFSSSTYQPGDTVEYKFSADFWTIQETLDPSLNCVQTTIDGSNTYTNRYLVIPVNDTIINTDCWASCGPC